MNKSINATFAFIKNSDGKILLIRRAKEDDFPGRWELPGGSIDNGEDLKSAIEREVLEETGLTVKAVSPISIIKHINPHGREVVRITYECILKSVPEINLSKDHDSYRWVESADLKKADKNSPLYDAVNGMKKK